MDQFYGKYQCYDKLKQLLEYSGFEVGNYKDINFGLQFDIVLEERKGIIRVYESKKGVRVDLSQIKDGNLLQHVSNLVDLTQGFAHQKVLHHSLTVDASSMESGGQNKGSRGFAKEDPDELIGTDESGKGDYFGPLVIAAVYVNSETGSKLRELKVDDSKKLSDIKINSLAPKIKELCPHTVVMIGNDKYNELYDRIKNLNKLLAWGHARAIENVLAEVECNHALSDQFGDPRLIENALMERGKKIILTQRPRAEENVAVAAASVLARYEFILKLSEMERSFGMQFPKGAGTGVIETSRKFINGHGFEKLGSVAKLHFKITDQML